MKKNKEPDLFDNVEKFVPVKLICENTDCKHNKDTTCYAMPKIKLFCSNSTAKCYTIDTKKLNNNL